MSEKTCPLCGRDMTAIETHAGRGELYCGHCDLTIGGNEAKTPDELVALLEQGTCKDVCASVSEFTCSECGFNCDLTSWISLFDGDDGKHRHHHHGTPNFCPNCGRKVVTK